MTNDEYRELVEFLGRKFVAIDDRFTKIDGQFVAVASQFAAMDRRFTALEERVEQGFREMSAHFDAIYARLDRLEQEYFAILEALRRIEATLTDERVRREMIERGLAELKERVVLLQTRIDELERRLQDGGPSHGSPIPPNA